MDLPWKISYDNFQRAFVLYPGSPRMMQADTQLSIQALITDLNALKQPSFLLSIVLNVLLFLGYIAGCILSIIFVPWPFNAIFSVCYVIVWVLLSDLFYFDFKRSVKATIQKHQASITASHKFFARHVVIYARKIYFEMVFFPVAFSQNFNYANVVPLIIEGFSPQDPSVPRGQILPLAPPPIPEIHVTPAPLPQFQLPTDGSQVSAYQPPADAPFYAGPDVPLTSTAYKRPSTAAMSEDQLLEPPPGRTWSQQKENNPFNTSKKDYQAMEDEPLLNSSQTS